MPEYRWFLIATFPLGYVARFTLFLGLTTDSYFHISYGYTGLYVLCGSLP